MDKNYTYFGLGIIALILITGMLFDTQTFTQESKEGTALITLVVQNEKGSETAYFSEAPSEQLFSKATTLSFTSKTDTENKIRCELICTK